VNFRIREDQGDGFRIDTDFGNIQYRPVDGDNEVWWIESHKRGGGNKLMDLMLQHHPCESVSWGATSQQGQSFREKWHKEHPEILDATYGAREPFEGQFDPYESDDDGDEEERDNPMSSNPNSYTVDLAAELYKMWHEKPPKEQFESVLSPPKKMFAVGHATHILYESDKWEEDGDYHRYIHKFTSLPTLYAENGELFPEDVQPYAEKKTASLLGVHKLQGEYGFPVLAHVHALTWTDGNVSRKIKFKSYKPVMSCSVDQRTVVIFADELLLINGGKMVVSAPGIID
jgi:hypothetical protein